MTRDGLLEGYKQGLLTRSELFASLTGLLAEAPDDLDAIRQTVAYDAALATAFNAWLEDLKSYPLVLSGNKDIPVTPELVARLGPPVVPELRDIVLWARVRFMVPPGERRTGLFAAQVKTREDGDTTPYGHHRVVVEPLADLDTGDGGTTITALVALSSPDSLLEALQGDVELFQGRTRIATASITPERRGTGADKDFLSAAE